MKIINQEFQQKFQQIANKPSPDCTCGECEIEDQYYQCDGCKRIVPWCFGAADKYFDYCDDCVSEIEKTLQP